MGKIIKQITCTEMGNPPQITLLTSPDWQSYELLDSGEGKKLERYGPYTFSRPEAQALWKPALPSSQWKQVQAVFHPTGGESGGAWEFLRPMPREWEMDYKV
jgi:23S rRNA (cytosine1962-C5)-methyltransferase